MGDDLKDMLDVTMKRLEIIMQDAKVALENRAEKLIMAERILLENCMDLEKEKRVEYLKKLLGFAKELYVQIIVKIPEGGDKDQYLQSYEVMREILACRQNLMKK